MATDNIIDIKQKATKYIYLINSGVITMDGLAKALTKSLVWNTDNEE